MERLIRLLPTILLAGFITALVAVCWLAPGRTANETGGATSGGMVGTPPDWHRRDTDERRPSLGSRSIYAPVSLTVNTPQDRRTGGMPAPRQTDPEGQATGTADLSDPPVYYRHHNAAYWAWKYRQRTRQLQVARQNTREARRALLSRPSVAEAINLAGAIYGYGSTLWRKAQCETGGTFSPYAHNASGASGLFQFLPSTWRTTPFAGFSIWSPYANAMAAGWMHARGRGGEWSCR